MWPLYEDKEKRQEGGQRERERRVGVRYRCCTLPRVRNYVVLIKEDDRMHEFKFASLNEAAARLNELGYKSITRFNSMYCHKGKISYPQKDQLPTHESVKAYLQLTPRPHPSC